MIPITEAYHKLVETERSKFIHLDVSKFTHLVGYEGSVDVVLEGRFTLEEMQIIVNELIEQKRKKETE